MVDDRHVIVIGSGPSGVAAAHALLRRGIPVTMLESGRSFPGGLLLRAAGRTLLRRQPPLSETPHGAGDDPSAHWYHALVPGGLSNYWTGAVPRFAPEDFCEGGRLHERYRWPLDYDDLAPYYARVERLIGVEATPGGVPLLPAQEVTYPHRLPAGWQGVAAHAAAQGQGLTALPLASGPPWLAASRGTGFNSFGTIVRTLRRFPRFRLLLGAHALRLEWDGARRRVRAVLYADRATGARHRLAGAAVVVAAGPLSSTKLLFDSACPDFPGGLGDSEGLLGRYLHDHPKDWTAIEVAPELPRLNHAAYLTRAPYADSAPLLAASCTIGAASTREKVRSILPGTTGALGVVIFGTMVPTAQHCVRPDPEQRDEFGLPGLDIHLHFDQAVLANVAAARERLCALLAGAGHRCTIRWAGSRLEPGTSVHYGGTVRMHQSPRHGMLDGWNRLHAVANVAVVDASCFTTGAEKNPTLTAMALASRAGDRLAEDLKRGELGGG